MQADHSHPTTEALFLIHQRGARELYQLTTGAAPAAVDITEGAGWEEKGTPDVCASPWLQTMRWV